MRSMHSMAQRSSERVCVSPLPRAQQTDHSRTAPHILCTCYWHVSECLVSFSPAINQDVVSPRAIHCRRACRVSQACVCVTLLSGNAIVCVQTYYMHRKLTHNTLAILSIDHIYTLCLWAYLEVSSKSYSCFNIYIHTFIHWPEWLSVYKSTGHMGPWVLWFEIPVHDKNKMRDCGLLNFLKKNLNIA